VPTAHDETSLYMHLLDDLFRQTPFLLFNSHEERHLLQRRFNLPAGVGRVVGMGVEPHRPGASRRRWPDLGRAHRASRVLAYLGRVENGKGCDELVTSSSATWRRPAAGTCCSCWWAAVRCRFPTIPDSLTGYVSEYLKQQLSAPGRHA